MNRGEISNRFKKPANGLMILSMNNRDRAPV